METNLDGGTYISPEAIIWWEKIRPLYVEFMERHDGETLRWVTERIDAEEQRTYIEAPDGERLMLPRRR